MPAKNSIKTFVADSYYHIYNRGVEKRNIFMDSQDYAVFLSYLKTYLLPKDENALQSVLTSSTSSLREKSTALKLLQLNNFSDTLSLISYCLIPNHFHFLVKQEDIDTIDRFMNSFATRYVLYFNKKYKRVGGLFQGTYKAVLIESDEQLLYLTRYIHENPRPISVNLKDYSYSSYSEYLGIRSTEWVKPQEILAHFSSKGFNSYEDFVENREIELEEYSAHLLSSKIFEDDYDD